MNIVTLVFVFTEEVHRSFFVVLSAEFNYACECGRAILASTQSSAQCTVENTTWC